MKTITEQMLDELREDVMQKMSLKRFRHTVAVEAMTARLCALFCPDKTLLMRAAALLHDITKELDSDAQISLCERYGLSVGDLDRISPKTFHARTAAAMIEREYLDFADPLVVSAVRWHTTGRADMTLTDQLLYLADYIDEPLTNIQNFMIDKLGMAQDFSLTESLLTSFKEILNIGTINSLLSGTVSVVGNTAIAIFSILFISFFFIKEDGLFKSIVLTITPQKYGENISRAIDSIMHLLKRYFTGILLESTIMFTFVSVVLRLFGMVSTDALTIATFVGVLNVIPYIGPLIGLCLGLTIALLSPIAGVATVGTLLIVGGTILTAQAIDNFVLQPVLYSNSVHAHPLEIFLVILIAGSVGGVVGMLFAIPSYNVIRVFAKEFFNNIRVVQKLTENM